MRPDQIKRLADLQEKIAEVFLEEADPDNWNGAGKPLKDMTRDERGGRVFDKKNAINTGSLLARTIDLQKHNESVSPSAQMTDEDADAELKRFEKQAEALLRDVQAR